MSRDLMTLRNFGSFMEFTDEEAEDSGIRGKCPKCGEINTQILPLKEVKERFRQELVDALPKGIANFAPSLKHFWFFSRCSKCGAEIAAWRS